MHARTFGASRFDFIHARFLLGSVSDYPSLYSQIYTALKPGGYFELSDMECGTFSDDGSVTKEMPSVQWWAGFREAFERVVKPIVDCERYPELMKDAGFEDITWRLLKRPTNDWPKDRRMKEIGKVSLNLSPMPRPADEAACSVVAADGVVQFSCLNFLEGIDGFTFAAF